MLDFNELTYHLLDVILVHCQNTKGPIPGSGPAVGVDARGAATPLRAGGMKPNVNGGAGFNAGFNAGRGAPVKSDSNDLTEAVYDAYLQVRAV